MRIVIGFFLLVFLGCGGGSGQDYSQNPKNIHDEYFSKQWYLAKNDDFYKNNGINKDAHLHGGSYYDKYRGRGVKIAIMDIGLDVFHQDLVGAIKNTYSVVSNGDDVFSEYYHGTAVTGLIGARANNIGIFGVASESDIIFLQYSQQMNDEDTIKLFQKAVEFGADVINCSWGTEDVGDSVREYIQYISKHERRGKGIVVVFAAGNNGSRISKRDESTIPEVISIGSSNKKNLRAKYSNYGPHLDILAPGGDEFGLEMISLDYSGYLGNEFGDYTSISGTSASAPLVSGVVAMMLEANPDLSSSQVQQILKDTADKIGDVKYKNGFNFFYGYGKVNIKKAIQKSLMLKP